MAKVKRYPTGTAAAPLLRIGAQLHGEHGTNNDQPLAVFWLPKTAQWLPRSARWVHYPYAHWRDTLDLWLDAAQRWNQEAPTYTAASIRAPHARSQRATGAYRDAAQTTRAAAAAWATIGHDDRAAWRAAAADLNAASLLPVIEPHRGRPRFATPRKLTGFALFLSEFSADRTAATMPPNHPNRTELPDMTELLTGTDYEQRLTQVLNTTDGNLTIVMYQVSAQWNSSTVAHSSLFDRLLEQPAKRSACRMILGRPTAGTSLAAANDEAADIMSAAGWYVRRVPAYPVLHAKTWLIETGYLYSGSHNLSNRATTHNVEAGLLTTSSAAVKAARQWTQGLWNAAT